MSELTELEKAHADIELLNNANGELVKQASELHEKVNERDLQLEAQRLKSLEILEAIKRLEGSVNGLKSENPKN